MDASFRALISTPGGGAAIDTGATPARGRVTGFSDTGNGILVHLKEAKPIRARLLVGADGSASTVSRSLQGNDIDRKDCIIAVRAYHADVAGDPDRCDLFFSRESFFKLLLAVPDR